MNGADTLFTKINYAKENGHVVNKLSANFSENPQGEFLIAPPNKDLNFCILIYNIDILPDKAVFSAGLAFREPKSNQLVAFKTDNISFSNTGGIAGPVKLLLISDLKFQFGKTATILLKGGSETFAEFDCSGLREFGIKGILEFNSNIIIPVDKNGDAINKGKVKTEFSLVARQWSEWLADINMPSFKLKGLTDFTFHIKHAVLDFHESRNSSSMVFPSSYPVADYDGFSTTAWEGFYLEEASVEFPKHFKSPQQRTLTAGVRNLIIDEFGFSGDIFAGQLLAYPDGELASWNFSIDSFAISMIRNQLKRGNMFGKLGLPILPDTSYFNYCASIAPYNNYHFSIATDKSTTIPALKAGNLTLQKNSYITIDIAESDITAEATLNGRFDITNKAENPGSPSFNLPSVIFNGMTIRNTEPYFNIDYLGLKNNNKDSHRISKYPVSIHHLYYKKQGSESSVGIDFSLNLIDKIAIESNINIKSKFQTTEKKPKLSFDKTVVGSLNIDAAFSCFTFNGQLQFIAKDPIYGNGMAGNIKFTMNKPSIAAKAGMLFGTINGHRYWFFDAEANWDKPGLPFVPGTQINGFAGGAMLGMREKNLSDGTTNNNYGKSITGKSYVPDPASSLALKAGISFKSAGGNSNSNAFAAKTMIEIQFNKSYGLNRLSLYGDINIMTSSSENKTEHLRSTVSQSASFSNWQNMKNNYQLTGKAGGPFLLDFDFMNKTYQGNCAVYIGNIANNAIKGSGQGGLAGEIAAYFGSNKWYFRVGTPRQPISLKLKAGALAETSLNAYFMAGTEVEPAAQLPREISSVLGDIRTDEMRNLQELAAGNAYAFGATLKMTAGSKGSEKNVSIYANLNVIAGFDINLSRYDNNVSCAGREGPPGINGWFANGQLYAFLQGRVGATFKTKVLTGSVDLLTLTTAARLYCQGPNPFYSNGNAAIDVNIAGVIKSKIKLHYAIGEQCELQQNKLSDTSIIVAISPADRQSGINVFSSPKVNFSIPINKVFKDVNGRQFLFRIKSFSLKDNLNNNIAGTIQWNSDGNELSYKCNTALTGKTKYKISITVEAVNVKTEYKLINASGTAIQPGPNETEAFEKIKSIMAKEEIKEYAFGNGRKIIRHDNTSALTINGKSIEESAVVTFETAAQPTGIDLRNITDAYPGINAINYYTDISNRHYIALHYPQNYLFNIQETKTLALITDEAGIVVCESKIALTGNDITYTMPSGILKQGKIYNVQIRRTGINTPSYLGRSVSQNTSATTGSGNKSNNDMQLLFYSFAVSESGTFKTKFLSMKSSGNDKSPGGKIIFGNSPELLDAYEVLQKRIKITSDFVNTSWFRQKIAPMYQLATTKDKLLSGYLSLSRDTSLSGLIPFKTIAFSQTQYENCLLKTDKTGLKIYKPSFAGITLTIHNEFTKILKNDFNDLVKGLTNYVCSVSKPNTAELNKFINYYSITTTTTGNSNASGLTVAAFGNPSKPINNNPYSGANPWLIKLASLSFNPEKDIPFLPITVNYYLRGSQKPVASSTQNISIAQ